MGERWIFVTFCLCTNFFAIISLCTIPLSSGRISAVLRLAVIFFVVISPLLSALEWVPLFHFNSFVSNPCAPSKHLVFLWLCDCALLFSILHLLHLLLPLFDLAIIICNTSCFFFVIHYTKWQNESQAMHVIQRHTVVYVHVGREQFAVCNWVCAATLAC